MKKKFQFEKIISSQYYRLINGSDLEVAKFLKKTEFCLKRYQSGNKK